MLENRKKLRKIKNIVMILMTIIMILGIFSGISIAVDSGNGTIDPIYRPEWEVVSSTKNTTNKTLEVTVKGLAYEETQNIDANTKINYSDNVVSTLATGDVSVFIGDTDITSHTNPTVSAGTTSTETVTVGTESVEIAVVTHVITLSNLDDAIRVSGVPYNEYSGYISLKIHGRGEGTDTYDANILVEDVDRNGDGTKDTDVSQNMMEIDSTTTGTWLDVKIGNEFVDFIEPEFRYEYANTVIEGLPDVANTADAEKKVIVVFDILDKYFSGSTLSSDDITLKILAPTPEVTVDATKFTKTLAVKTISTETTAASGLTYKTNGDIYFDIDGDGTAEKVGQRYELVISGLDQGNGFDYSGPMSITFLAGKVTDSSNNSNAATTITIGIDETDGDASDGGDGGSQQIIDIVNPVWNYTDKTVTTDASGVTSANVTLQATDKYFKESTLELDDIQVLVDGEDKTAELDIDLTTATAITNGAQHTFSLTNFEETYEEFLAERAKYAANSSTGRLYREFSGPVQLVIPKGTATDNYGNDSERFTIDLGTIDTLKPEVVKVSSSVDTSAKTQTIVFDITDKYIATSDINGTALNADGTINNLDNVDTSKIHVLIDNEETTDVTKEITNIQTLTATINGTSKTIGYRYTLLLSDFEQTARNAKDYKDWSGTVSIKIDASTAKDSSGTGNTETTLVGEFIDCIKPDLKYTHQSTDISYGTKTYTMTFDVTDKYYSSGKLTIDDLEIYMNDGKNNYNLKDEPVTISFNGVDKKASNVNVTNATTGVVETVATHTIGHTYTLTISNLEQLEIKSGHTTADYSGIVTVAVAGSVIKDRGPIGDGANQNTNNPQTITSGVNIPGGTLPDDAEVVDVVDPLWVRDSSEAYTFTPNSIDSTKTAAKITIVGTDTYLNTSDTDASTLTSDEIEVYVNGTKNESITPEIGTVTKLEESRTVYGTTSTVQYGVQYTITLTGFAQDANQVKIRILEDAITDQSGNGNKETDLILYNVLIKDDFEPVRYKLDTSGNQTLEKWTGDIAESDDGSNTGVTFDVDGDGTKDYIVLKPFLKESQETQILNKEGNLLDRRFIEKVIFVDSTEGSKNSDVKRIWDVSAQGDDSILAWTSQSSWQGLTVYIGSNDEIFANQDSSNLFRDVGIIIGKCVATEALSNMDLVNTNNVTNMSYMFHRFGYAGMTNLNLGENFDTSNVTNMEYMFSYTGYSAMTQFTLPRSFDTSNVTNMKRMFSGTGYTAMTQFTLPNTFDTSKVENMEYMFGSTGYTAMTQFTLPSSFDTTRVKSMLGMFDLCGYTSMTKLDLSTANFDTKNVETMYGMFAGCGYTAMTELDLGTKFDTSKVTEMSKMFMSCGYTALQELDLGDNFDTSKVTSMNAMFKDCGYTAMTSLDLGDKFNTTGVKYSWGGMKEMFQNCGYTALTSLDLGNQFDTRNVSTFDGHMANMFDGCGATAMTSLDLGPAFVKIANASDNFIINTGKAGALTIYAPESIYSSKTAFKLNGADTTTTIPTNTVVTDEDGTVTETTLRGTTIIPIYKPEWEVVTSSVNTTNKTVGITVKGFAYENQTINDNVKIKYAEDVTSTLANEDISVFIEGTDITTLTNPTVATGTTSTETVTVGTETVEIDVVNHVITLSNLDDAVRLTGIPFNEWSGYISLKIHGRGEETDTYSANVLTENVDRNADGTKDTNVNQNMMEIDSTGTWLDIKIGNEFADLVKPEFRYESANTEIVGLPDDADTADAEKKVIVVFDVLDKYFSGSTLSSDDITLKVLAPTPEVTVDATKFTKTLAVKTISTETTAASGLTYKTNGDIYFDIDGDGTAEKVGQRYELVISGLDQGNGFDYSGPMSISFLAGKVTDSSNNSNAATTITIGIDETDGDATDGGDGGSQQIIDIVNPVWSYTDKTVTTDANGVTSANVTLQATDKYFKESTLELDDIQVLVDGEDKTAELDIDLTTATAITNGATHTFSLTNFEETYEEFLAERAKYAENSSTGRLYREFSGPVQLVIPKGTATDNYGNDSERFTIDLGTIDTLKPEVVKVSSSVDTSAKTQTIVFDITDKYLASSDINGTALNADGTINNLDNVDTSKIHVLVDNEETTDVTKEITNIQTLTATINGTSKTIGYRYTLLLSDFEQTARNAKEYKDWSGTVSIKIDANTAKDSSGTGNAETTFAGEFIDCIKPDLKYTHQSTDISYGTKTYTMTFDVTDKYYSSGKLTIDDLEIYMNDGKNNYNLKDEPVTISFNGVDKKASNVNVTNATTGVVETVASHTIGHTYTLTISNLEQLEIKSGHTTADYSGIVTVAVAGDVIKDRGPLGNEANQNTNNAQTITSGVNIPGGTLPDDAEVVDVVDPLWVRDTSSANAVNQTATITVIGTDTYLNTSDTDASTLTSDEIEVYINGTKNTSIIPEIGAVTKLEESRTVYGTTSTVQYGVQYTITLTGFEQDANQVKIRILENAITDQSGNGNKETDLILYNVLKKEEGSPDFSIDSDGDGVNDAGWKVQPFLGESVETTIYPEDSTGIPTTERRYIQKLIFVDSTAGSKESGVVRVWDVSAQGDGSILAWKIGTTVYVGSDYEIFGNQDSSELFYAIAAEGGTESILENLHLLNTSSVTNMRSMFNSFGHKATMTDFDLGDFDTTNVTDMSEMFRSAGGKNLISLDLGNKFDTSNVTNMSMMFYECGINKMTNLELGDKFDTSNVTDMNFMFAETKALQTLNLGDKFNTSKVNNMSYMFYNCGYNSMENLDLGNLFDTRNVSRMSSMFRNCGYTALTKLDLGENFDTSKVTNMSRMFEGCGYTAMTQLDLGDKFNTNKVTNMYKMFENCGYTALTSLDLGDKFNTSLVTEMKDMFNGCGYTAMTTLDLGPAFTKISEGNVEEYEPGWPESTVPEHIAYDGFINNTGKAGELTIYAPESIYSSQTALKLNSADTTTTIPTNTVVTDEDGTVTETTLRGTTITPIYKPEWTKVSSEFDNETNPTQLKVNLKGTASETLTVDANTKVNYSSNVTTYLTADDITVYVNGVQADWITKALSVADPATAAEVTQTLTLSGFEELARRTGKPFKEWSGNISIRIGGRGQATSTYTANTLVDVYGNQSMMATDETGTWIDVIYKDADSTTNQNTNGTMFIDTIKPEFTYKTSETIIGNGNNGNTKKVTVNFDVTDKYYSNTTMTANDITIKLIDTTPETTIDPANITKTLTKTHHIIMQADGTVTYEEAVEGTEYELQTGETKVGEKYQLLIEGLEQRNAEGFSDGYTYSGPMSISFPADKVIDKSNNKNNATTITIGVDETDGDNTDGGDSGSAIVVDVVDPIWEMTYVSVETGIVKLRAKDKYYSTSTLTEDNITVYVNGAESDSIIKSITGPVEIEAGTAYEYTLLLSNITLENAGLVAFEPTNADELVLDADGHAHYRQENGGYIQLEIDAGTVIDESGNGNKVTEFDVGTIDVTKPEIYDIQKTQNAANGKTTFIFNVTDRNFYTPTEAEKASGITNEIIEDEITLWLDGIQTDSITIESLTYKEIMHQIDETVRPVGHQYTLVLSDIVETQTEFVATGRQYRELSGTIEVKIAETAATDMNDNTLNTDTTTISDFVDFIKPEITYRYSESSQENPGDINYEGKTFTMVFDVIDKYFNNSTLTINDLTILIDGETPDWTKISKNLTSEDIKATFNKSVDTNGDGKLEFVNNEYVIGKRYTLVLSNLEQLQIKDGDQYADYSGIITVAIPENKVTDTEGNGNNAKTITSGLDIVGDVQESGNGQIVDVVDPIWERASSSANAIDPANPTSSTATITVRGTDKYYASSSLTGKIKVLAQSGTEGAEATDITDSVEITISEEPTKVYKTGTTDVQVGDEYTITIKGFAQDVNQIKIEIAEDAMLDTSGNGNKATQMLVYNILRYAGDESAETSGFLGNTTIQRQYIENVTFLSNTSTVPATGWWDVSAAKDNSIKAWATQTEDQQSRGIYTVYIASDDPIFGNPDSSYLFSYIGYGESCTATQTVTNLNALNTNSVTNMSYMFQYFGYRKMSSLSLGTFDTTNVTSMSSMFNACGYMEMESLNLGSKFNTSNVTTMYSMFKECGYTLMGSLDLGATGVTFNTGKVKDMSNMFMACGYTKMTTLKLGTQFDTRNVLSMSAMFNECGYTAMTSLDLSSETSETNTTQFNTSNVTNMNAMFMRCGFTAMASLNLGNNFNTSNVQNMASMFQHCAETAITSLNLGDKFDTSSVTNMNYMFYDFARSAPITSLDLGNLFDTSSVSDFHAMFYGVAEYSNTFTSLDLGDKFDTSNANRMVNMFTLCGARAMVTLDLGPAFKMATGETTNYQGNTVPAYYEIFRETGKNGECVIYAPESIYSSRTAFKLNSTSTTTITYDRGTITPIYKPEWTKVSSSLDIDETNLEDSTISIVLKGNANKAQTINDNVKINYTSNVTSALTADDITVYINGVQATWITKTLPAADPATGAEVTQTLTLSKFEETTRRTGVPFKEWSGNIKIKIAGRGQATTTYTANKLVDVYGNQSMMATDETDGTWIDVTYGDTETDRNTDGTMFADFIRPEFTYKSSETIIGNGNNGDTKKVTVAFEVTDKYFNNTTMIPEDITIKVIDTDPETTIDPAHITKTLTKTHDIVMKSDKTTEYREVPADDAEYELVLQAGETHVGEKYELLIEGLEQRDANGFSNGYTYSGPMSIGFASGKVADLSGNTNNATTITIGVDETDGDNDDGGDSGSSQIVDVVDPVITYFSSTIDRTNNTATLTIKAEDKYFSTQSLVGAEDSVKVRLEYQDAYGVTQTIDIESIEKTITANARTEAQSMTFSIKLENFGIYEGRTSLVIPPDVVKDSSGNGNKETVIPIDKDGDGSAFEEGIVDFTKPTWEYVTSSIERDRDGETGTVTLEVKGTDIYFDDAYFNDEDLQLDLSAVKVYINNEENTEVDINFATNADGSIKKEYIEEVRELAEGYTRLLKGVKYTLVLSNFGTNEGAVKIEIPANAIRDTSLNGNIATQIDVGNPDWVESDVEIDATNPKYTAFRNDIVDYIKPVIEYQYVENTNPLLDRTAETVDIIFTATDTNFLESNIGIEDFKIYIDNMQVYGTGANTVLDIGAELLTPAEPTDDGDGLKYTLRLSNLELNGYIEDVNNNGQLDEGEDINGNSQLDTLYEMFERHSGIIKFVIAADQVADTSGNKNIETTIIVDNDDGNDEANGIIADFANPNIYYQDKYVNWQERYALITLRATDRFFDTNTELKVSDIKLYDQQSNIDITNNFTGKITIAKSNPLMADGNIVGYDYTIRLDDFEEEFKMKISIKAGAKDVNGNVLNGIGDTSGNVNDATDILVDLDNRKPSWKYVSTDTSNFETTGAIGFTIKGVDKYLDLTNSNLAVANLKVIKDGEIFLDGTNATDATKISISNDVITDTTEKSKTYTINITGLTQMGTYSLVIAKDTLVDEFSNKSAATTISFSNSAIASNTGNYRNVTYHVTPDMELVHSSYVHELMSVNTTGTNYQTKTFRPSTLGELFNNGENPLFAEPMYVPSVDGYTVSKVYKQKSFAGWAEADSNGNAIDGGVVYGLYDEIPVPDDMTEQIHLKAVWQDATVVFVSASSGNNSNNGQLPTTPVKDLAAAYSKINSSRTAEANIIVIMDAVEYNSTATLSGNATITSVYAGVDYRKDNSAELKISSNMIINGDIIFDNIKLYASSTTVSDGEDYVGNGTYTNMLISNYSGDITLGRGVTTPTDNYTFGAIIGGNYETETSTGQRGTHTIRIEAGKYNNIIAGSTLASSTETSKSVTYNVVIGNMRDAAVSRNDKLTITGYVTRGENEQKSYPSGATSANTAADKDFANVTLYSGTFTGANKFTKADENIAIYLRSINGETDGLVNFEMFGGVVNGNIYAGSRIASVYDSQNFNTMKFYGGNVNGNIFGQGANDNFTGSTTITVRGNFNMTGNVYGGSNVTSAIDNSVGKGISIITVQSGSITGNIYGGSNVVEAGASYVEGATLITIEAGTVSNIYGSGYNCGNTTGTITIGETSYTGTNVIVDGGTVTGNIFGGAYQNQARIVSNITVLTGVVNGNIYGGNDNIESQLEGDTLYQNVNIIIGDTDSTEQPTVKGTIYGGGKYDKVETVTIQLFENAHITPISVYGGSDTNATTVTANIYLKGMTVSEIYGGGQSAGTVAISNIYLESGTVTEVYGGGFKANTTQSNILLDGTATVTSIYGGSNTSGTVTTSNVTLKSGTLTNVFGGGNSASVGTANVTLDGITIDSIHGGSKDAGVTTTTNVTLTSGTVGEVFGGGLDVGATTANVKQQGATVTNIYGGNNSGTGSGGDTGTANVEIVNSTVGNVYGGNKEKGTTRYTNINIHGTSTITGNVFGGGYKSEIGKSGETGSTTINIAGGTINGDINGGSEQSTVYGNTNINIGKDATNSVNSELTAGNINIIGIIYGAGDTLTAGTTTVVGNTNITMDNSTTSPITYFTADGKEKSIYGSGNGGAIYSNGTTTDRSAIHIKDFGISTTPYLFKSIENTGNLYIGSSVIELSGALDATDIATEVGHYYTLNTVTNSLTIYGGTTLYTQRGFNKVGGFYSYVNKTSTKATVEIADGVATTNVDNRLYTLEGINLIFAKEEVTLTNKATLAQDDWGEVTGMAYFGMYKNTSTGKQYNLDLFRAGTYVEGQYNSSHNVNVDGFYTTVVDATTSTEVAQVIDTVNYTNYCDWIINAPTINYDVDLVASTYGKQSVAELLLNYEYASDYTYAPGTVYTLNQVSSNALKPGIELVDPSDPTKLPTISTNANNNFGLTMETTNSGWQQQALTTIYSASNGSFEGDSVYMSDTQATPSSIKFKVHNSLNITEEKDLGIVTIILTGQQPISGSGTEAYTFKVAIAVNLQTIVDELKEQYTPSFTDRTETELSYTTDSRVDLSYILYKDMAATPYASGDYRVISTTQQLPAGTRITMKDYGQGDNVNRVYYYHVTGTETETDGTRYLYRLSNFIDMGSTDDQYADIESNVPYYNSTGKYVLEKYDISIDFIDSGINVDRLAQETYLELRNSSGAVKYNNGDTIIKYNLKAGQNAVATQDIETDSTSYSVVESIEIPIDISASILEKSGILDTKYHDKIAGIAVQIIGESGVRIKSPELQNFKLTNTDTNEVYEADSNGVIRMPIIEGLGSKSGNYELSITQSNVSPGLYTAQVIFYTADDGKYYGTEPELEPLEFNITFISRLAGALGVQTENESSRIINKSTGLNLVENSQASKAIDMTVGINNPTNETNIRVELYKRNPTYTSLTDETTYTGTSYTLVDIKDYLQGTWTEAVAGSKEYVISPKKTYETAVQLETIEFEKAIVEGISTGEYKLVFKAYSDDTLVQTFSKTFIVTP